MHPWLRLWGICVCERVWVKGHSLKHRASISFHRKVSLPSSELMHDLATVLTNPSNRMLKASLLQFFSPIFVALYILLTHTDCLGLDLSILHQPFLLPIICNGQSPLGRDISWVPSVFWAWLWYICSAMKYSIKFCVPFGHSSHDMCMSAHLNACNLH